MADERPFEALSEGEKVVFLLQKVRDLETLNAGLTAQLRKSRPLASTQPASSTSLDADAMAVELERARSGTHPARRSAQLAFAIYIAMRQSQRLPRPRHPF